MASPAVALLGREQPLALLEQALSAACDGRGGLAIVSGEAGIGKSTLVGELVRLARERQLSVVTGRAWEFADAPPGFALRPCLRSIGIDPVASAEQHSDFLLWERCVEALAASTRHTPSLWVVEDLHAADLQTLDLLTFLTQPLKSVRALVVVTRRDQDPRLSERMCQRFARMARDGLELRLGPLGPSDVRLLMSRVSDVALTDATLERLIELSHGNPLYVGEYARALSAAQGHPDALASIPPTLRQVVLERASELPEATLQALTSGAVVGREFSAAVVGRMLGVLPANVIDELLPALRAGVIGELGPGHFRFSHALVRDAVYESATPSERARLHGRAAAALGPGTETPDALIERAHHLLLGLPTGRAERVLEACEQAVRLLIAQGAPDRAFSLRERIDRARADGVLPAANSEALLDSARLALSAGRFQDGHVLCERLIAQARASGDASLLARVALAMGSSLRPGAVDRTLVVALGDALSGLPPDSPLGCRVLARLAAALQPAADPQAPVAMARRAISVAKTLGDDELLLEVLAHAGSALIDYVASSESRAVAWEFLQLSQKTNNRPRILQASARLAVECVYEGGWDDFSSLVDESLQLSAELCYPPRLRWRPLLLASMRAAAFGRFDESERLIAEVRQLATHCDDPALQLSLMGHQTSLLRLQRRDRELHAMMGRFEAAMSDVPQRSVILSFVRMGIHAHCCQREATERELRALAPHRHAIEPWRDYYACMAEAIALVGSDAERRELRERLVHSEISEIATGHIELTYNGPVRRLLGLVSAGLGDLASARTELEAALSLMREREFAPWVARIEFELGQVLARLGKDEEARTLFASAVDLAGRLAMPGLLEDLRRLLGERPSVPAGAPSAPLSLEPDGEVWVLRSADRCLRLRDSRGLRLLSRLVQRPGEEIHVLTLADDRGQGAGESSAGEHLDEAARRAYQRRLVELGEELDEAESNADRGRAEKLVAERDALVAELSRAVGLGGRSRTAGSATERARINVQKRLKAALARVAEADAELGRYLERAVRTGAFCSYWPGPGGA